MPLRPSLGPPLLAAGLLLSTLVAAGAGGTPPAGDAATAPGPGVDHGLVLQSAARSNEVRERVLVGRSVAGRPIWAFRKGNPQARRKVVVLGQMHGNEPAGVQTARYIKRHVSISDRADVWIVPTMNPDGFARGTRGNARGVDLNRNWPTTGWRRTARDDYYSGPRAASEPETRAMVRFLRRVRPRFIASIHQPFGVVARSKKNLAYTRRLSRQLDLPVEHVGIGCRRRCRVDPTMTSWYNARPWGTSVTIEFRARNSLHFRTTKAGLGILRATRAY